MRVEYDLKLAQADSRIEEAEHNIRQVASLIPTLTARGYATMDLEDQLTLMSDALFHLKEQRRLIATTLH